ncbi:hypothetical protein AVEN_96010-1 [Araneus ventricosus]|uniref:Uncharacterized protein n=1 Tax=Araneus ventricosus TaxID=182803 RepID=A0A4Y2B5M4_ARAVE|nr:hypothetical protein AVEN_96010-1 [Araneus ventricosus]
MAILPPGGKRILQFQESDAVVEIISSSASEGDTLEYNMSEDLKDSPAVIIPPPSTKPENPKKNILSPQNRKTYNIFASLFSTWFAFFREQLMIFIV